MVRLWVKRDDRFSILYQASVATNWTATLLVKNKGGKIVPYDTGESLSTANRSVQTPDLRGIPITEDGEIVGLGLAVGTAEPGQFYMVARIGGLGRIRQLLASGYVTTSRVLGLGDFAGPGDGRGDTTPESVGTDIAGNVNTSHDLSLTNAVRRIDALSFYYHCDDTVATRTFILRIRSPGPLFPTGFDAGSDRQIMQFSGPSLTADQDGLVYMTNAGYKVSVDDSVVTTSDNTTDPNPFPFWVEESDLSDYRIEPTNGVAADTYGGHVFGEIWML